tara:strand:- start:1100 stop:1729 length:630 start_codon:yes stop_codon:yes gene_type:complete
MEKGKSTSIIELIIAEDNLDLTISAISLVTTPAIEENFVFFNDDKKMNLTLAKIDEEQRCLVSPALIPNKQIFRYDADTDSEYYVYFSKETVKAAASLYLKHNNNNNATYQHEEDVLDVHTVESWIKEGDNDKSKMYGYDLPDGTWFVKMEILNDDMWAKIKSGELKGLSIEGFFVNKLQKMSSQKDYTETQILEALHSLIFENQTDRK